MKRIFKYAAVNILGVALISTGIPLQAANYHESDQPARQAQVQTVAWHGTERGYRAGNNDRDRRDSQRDDRDARSYDYREDYRVGGYGYAYPESHDGRTAAIIGGSAAAGALIGAAAGHGEGAAIGAVVGGVAGAIASQAVHDRDWR
jgi:hypothetical protein